MMDAIFDILVGVLFIAIPFIFKAIGNSLEKSGKTDKAKKFKKIADAMTDDKPLLEDVDIPVLDEILEKRRIAVYGEDVDKKVNSAPELFPESRVQPVPVVPEVRLWEARKQAMPVESPRTITRKKKQVLMEDSEPKRKGEKIDPKKLVIYSEIMTPKYKN